ncbi:AMP-dependent synthetase/ligase [Trinickia sp. NRRL B-1857]|uniref:AMP-dependent synthetase/ligase n=1 Tax=Trinickia sp. NRRL B-1857 TaxID=3162879 RepID=UPI003D2D5F36
MSSELSGISSEALSSIQTLPELFAWRVSRTPSGDAYRYFDGASAKWMTFTWQQSARHVARCAQALNAAGLPEGARVALLLPNGPQTVFLDQAVLARGCVPVPMHALDNSASIAYILSDSDASLLIAQNEKQWQDIVATGVPLPALKNVVVMEKGEARPATSGPLVWTYDEWLSAAAGDDRPMSVRPPKPSDLAALVYTSGTTGKPKGVMLTHENVVSNVKAVMQRVAADKTDVFLSFLPLSHTFERTAGYYLPVAAGACVAFARSTKLLLQDFQMVRPTVLISVPRIYERIYAGVEAALSTSTLKLRLFRLAQAVGWRRFCRAHGLSADDRLIERVGDAFAWPALGRPASRVLVRQFGGRLRLAVSGGAPLSPAVAHCFLGLGVPIAQGYGMTEASPVVAVNTRDDNDPSTVGRPLQGIEIRISDDGELLVRGPNVMRGYWKRDADTASAIVDGWLRTGDRAEMVSGRIRIVGRAKEIIVTSTGEKIAPADLELAITADPAFEQAYVVGDNRSFIACVVVLGRAYWNELAMSHGLDPLAPESLKSQKAAETAIRRIRELTRNFPYYAQPRAVVLTSEPWTIENTLMTPTLKLKRNNLAAHFARDIDRIYQK